MNVGTTIGVYMGIVQASTPTKAPVSLRFRLRRRTFCRLQTKKLGWPGGCVFQGHCILRKVQLAEKGQGRKSLLLKGSSVIWIVEFRDEHRMETIRFYGVI